MTRSLEIQHGPEIRLEDVVAMARAGYRGGLRGETVEEMVQQYIAHLQLGLAMALVMDGRIFILTGIVPVRPGIGSCWNRAALDLEAAGMRATPTWRKAVRDEARAQGYVQLMASQPDHIAEDMDRWVRFFGFERCGGTEGFFPNGQGAVHYCWDLAEGPAQVSVH